jgi:hypothetical protein
MYICRVAKWTPEEQIQAESKGFVVGLEKDKTKPVIQGNENIPEWDPQRVSGGHYSKKRAKIGLRLTAHVQMKEKEGKSTERRSVLIVVGCLPPEIRFVELDELAKRKASRQKTYNGKGTPSPGSGICTLPMVL